MYKMYKMLFPGFRPRAFTTSYDDGVEQDKRLIALMEKYGIKGTFNISSGLFAKEGTVYGPEDVGHMKMTVSESLKTYSSPNVEIAMHGKDHCFPYRLPGSVAVDEFLNDRTALEKLFGRMIRGGAYPNGNATDETAEIMRLCGLLYMRRGKSTHSFMPPEDLLNIEPTCRHKDPELSGLVDAFLTDPSYPRPYPYLFYLWGHSYEFDQNGDWDIIEEVFKKVGGRADVWYATNYEVFSYIKAFREIIYSADGKKAYNPTVKTLYLLSPTGERLLPPGETVDL